MPPDPEPILELLTAFRRSKAMFAAVSLGVFDALADAPKTLPQLADELRCSVDGLQRLLDACVCLQLLSRDGSNYRNTPAAAAYLCAKSPSRLTGYLNYSNAVMWRLWAQLEDAVREGSHRWPQVFGWEGPIFGNFFRTEEAKRKFLMGMHGFGLISSPHVVSAFDLSGYSTFVDLGGATGHLVIAACERYPHLRGVVFDLPEATPLAREIVGGSSARDRIEIIAGDFFSDRLPHGDLYALGRIVHDWSQPKIERLLARIYEALPSGGGLLIAEKLLSDDRTAPTWAHLQNLNMLTCTEGKERTFVEYRELLSAACFVDIQCARTASPLDAVLARKG